MIIIIVFFLPKGQWMDFRCMLGSLGHLLGLPAGGSFIRVIHPQPPGLATLGNGRPEL